MHVFGSASALAKKARVFILLFLVPLLLYAEPQPRQVAKNGDIDVPAGMHLFRDRAGNRWLLPEGMTEAPEREIKIKYFEATEKPRVIGMIGTHQILNGPISALDAVVTTDQNDPRNLINRLPRSLGYILRLEKQHNQHATDSSDLQSLGVFGPAAMTTFKIPYIPMPEEDFEFAHISSYASHATVDHLRFKMNGKNYIRFFIHPNYVDSYKELIAKYGIVYHYDAISTSSPRSLIDVDPDSTNPADVFWEKVSVHRKIDGSVRINTDKKARRAIIMSEAISEVPTEAMQSYNVQFMLEPAAFQPKGKVSSTISRQVPQEFIAPPPNELWIPAFILQNTGATAVPGINIAEMAAVAGMTPVDFIREKIVRPLIYSFLSMGMKEGLPGELHVQNFYFKVRQTDKGWVMTDLKMFKDNDGFRFDTELAMRLGRPLDYFARFDDPFGWGKFSNAIGTGAEGLPFLGSWYYKLIRNVSGFETLAAYMLRAINELQPNAGMDKPGIQLLFDTVAAQEAEKITGIPLARENFGYAKDKGLNLVLTEWREKLSREADIAQIQDSALQTLLGQEWERLKSQTRTSALRRSLPNDAIYLLHREKDGALIIEARTPRPKNNPDPTVGFAMVESPQTAEGQAAHQRLNSAFAHFRQKFGGHALFFCRDLLVSGL